MRLRRGKARASKLRYWPPTLFGVVALLAAIVLIVKKRSPAKLPAEEAEPLDAGTVDASTVDAGTVDAGTVDAGTVDAGWHARPRRKRHPKR